jgi:hypothetical protein
MHALYYGRSLDRQSLGGYAAVQHDRHVRCPLYDEWMRTACFGQPIHTMDITSKWPEGRWCFACQHNCTGWNEGVGNSNPAPTTATTTAIWCAPWDGCGHGGSGSGTGRSSDVVVEIARKQQWQRCSCWPAHRDNDGDGEQ